MKVTVVCESICSTPSVALVCASLRELSEITLVGVDGQAGVACHKATRGLDLWSSTELASKILSIFGRNRRPEQSISKPDCSVPSAAVIYKYDWVRYIIRFGLRTPSALYKLMKSPRPDIIICIDAFYLPAVRLVSFFKRCPYAYLMLEIYPNQSLTASKFLRLTLASIEKLGLGNASAAFVQDPTWGRLLRIRYKFYKLHCVTVTTCPPMLSQNQNMVCNLEKNQSPLKAYYHGMYYSNRGLENLILALQYTSNIELYLRGYGGLESELRRLSAVHGLTSRVHFLPPVAREELAASAVGYDVGITPADCLVGNGRFGVGFKTYEYMMAGLALLVPPTHALAPLINRTCAGMTYSFGDPVHLANALNFLSENRDQVALYKLASRDWATREFNENNQAELFRKAVIELVSRKY